MDPRLLGGDGLAAVLKRDVFWFPNYHSFMRIDHAGHGTESGEQKSKRVGQQVPLLLAVSVVLILAACLPPRMNLWFQNDSGESDHFERMVIDDNVTVTLTTHSYFGSYCSPYSVGVIVHLKWKPEVSQGLIIAPSAIQLLVEGLPMEPGCSALQACKADTLQKQELRIHCGFARDIGRDSSMRAAAADKRPWSVKIVLNDLLIYNGQPIQFDTIQAIEWRPCDNELMTPKERRKLKLSGQQRAM